MWKTLSILIFLSLPALAQQHQELIIKKDTTVYKKRSTKSGDLIVLEKGDRVPISTRDYGPWVKIKTEVSGKLYYGWIPKKQISGFRIRKVDKEVALGREVSYHQKRALGIFTNFSYAALGEESFVDTLGNNVDLDSASGSNIFFGFYYDHPMSVTKQLHLFFSMREHELSGEARYASGPNNIDLDMTQKFIAFGATLKNYSSREDDFWWGYGLEVAKTNEIELDLVSQTTKIPDEELGFYVYPHLAFGYNYEVSDNLYLIPEGKANLAINTGSLAYAIDLKLGLSYTF